MPNRFRNRFPSLCAGLCLAVLVLASCAPAGPDEIRSRYTAELYSFAIQPVYAEAPVVEPTEGEEGADAAEGGEAEAAPAEPELLRQDALLDIMIQHTASQSLDAITVDITHGDADQNEKATYRHTIETGELPRGVARQFSFTLEDVDFADGDGFFVEVRHPVSETERSDYPELKTAG